MLVDLSRNDLQRVCHAGTVDMVEFMTIRRYSHIMHLESTVVGDLRPGRTAYDALVATFPAGTLCGAPKPRAMALIDEYEGLRRGVYGGVVGYLDFAGDLDMAIAIRTAVIKDGVAHVQAGRGHRRRLGAAARVRGDPAQGGGGHPRGPGGPGYACARPARCRGRRLGVGVVTSRLTSKRAVSAAVAVPALVLLLATTRTWITGRSTEPLLGGGAVSATGSQVAPGVVALALVCLVALVTTLTGGPVVRRVSSVVLVLAAAGSVALTVAPLSDPEQALGRVAAAGLGRTGVVRTTAEVSGWAWTALVASVVLFLASLLAAVAAGRWSGLSSRFEVPVDESGDAPPVGEPRPTPDATGRGTHRTTWDELSEGRDPTLDQAAPSPDEADQADPHTPSTAPDSTLDHTVERPGHSPSGT